MDNVELIKNYILSGSNDNKRLGVEVEHFVFDDDFNIITEEKMSDVLIKASDILNAKLKYENGFAIELDTGDYTVTLEPGVQLEISITAVTEVYEAERIYKEFRLLFDKLLDDIGYKMESCGIFPLLQNGDIKVEDIKLIDKKRYHLMDSYLSKTGRFARYMMRGSCATQVSIDFSSEADLLEKLKYFEKLTPFLTLLMENQYNLGVDKKTFLPYLLRTQVWDEMDKDRSGYIDGALSDDFNVRKLAEFLYNKPFIIDNQNDELVFTADKTGREFYDNRILEHPDYYISMFFHHVRVKKYIEIRCADGNSPDKIFGYTALIKALAYNKDCIDKINELLSFIHTEEDLINIDEMLKREGAKAVINGIEAVHYLTKILEIGRDGLDINEKKYIDSLINTNIINDIYDKNYVKFDDEDKKDIHDMGMFLKNSPIGFYYDKDINLYYLPKIFTKYDIDKFRNAIDTFYRILNKIILLYKTDANVRKLFSFDKNLEELILNSFEAESKVPMSRIDLFYNEESSQFKFCEINTDGTSSMIEDKILNDAQNLSLPFRNFIKDYDMTRFELFDSWVYEFIKYYNQFREKYNSAEKPNILITDFLDKGITAEFKMFKEYFEKNGYRCEISDIRDLIYKDNSLYTTYKNPNTNEISLDMKVDAVYRRAVTSDIMRDFDKVTDFINAVRDKKVCLIGDFHTQIIHNKIIFYILHLPEIQSKLTKAERIFVNHHVPYTFLLNDENIKNNKEKYEQIVKNHKEWILKPLDSYGSKGVTAGYEVSDTEWEKLLKDCTDKHYIVQEFADIYFTKNIMKIDDSHDYVTTSNLTNLYCYNEKFAGILSRASLSSMISMRHDEMTMPTLMFNNG